MVLAKRTVTAQMKTRHASIALLAQVKPTWLIFLNLSLRGQTCWQARDYRVQVGRKRSQYDYLLVDGSVRVEEEGSNHHVAE